jgi:hypothetical protein
MLEFLLEHGVPWDQGEDSTLLRSIAAGHDYCPEEMLALLKKYRRKKR